MELLDAICRINYQVNSSHSYLDGHKSKEMVSGWSQNRHLAEPVISPCDPVRDYAHVAMQRPNNSVSESLCPELKS